MYELLSALYVTTQGAVVRLDHDAVRVDVDREMVTRLPLMRLGSIVMLGRVSITPALIERCAEDGRSVVWLNRRGRFKARIEGPTRGNVLLRRAQHLALSDREHATRIARQIVAGKVQNSRQVLLRAARESGDAEEAAALSLAAEQLAAILRRVRDGADLETTRGDEGDAARTYFGVFGCMVRGDRQSFVPNGRTRRPPRDRVNAALSFLYALLRAECCSAVEAIGLDPQVGYLHALRPGRPALALDLMEELRPILADRLAITLINRRQLKAEHFEATLGGAVQLTDEGRKAVVEAYEDRKAEEVEHRVLKQKVPLGLVPHVQARLLARHLRGDLPDYLPFVYR